MHELWTEINKIVVNIFELNKELKWLRESLAAKN